jgi:hypothetical protein
MRRERKNPPDRDGGAKLAFNMHASHLPALAIAGF